MPKDLQDIVRQTLVGALTDGAKNALSDGAKNASPNGNSKRGLSGVRGIALGAGAAALAPVAAKGVGKLTNVLGVESPTELLKNPREALEGIPGNVGERLGSTVGDKVSDKVDSAGGPSGILKDTVKGALPFGGGDGGSKGGAAGVGQGRRMPVQQSVDIGLPLETVYNQFTQFEQWPEFMHRVKRATQEDECTVSFAVKIWGITREFSADIQTQRPDEVIKWQVSQGMTHTGIVTFHELGPRLTRVLVGFDVDPGGLLEKFARGARHVKRAGRGDLHRFKAFIEMMENESGAWRGVIEDGELVEEHDPSYDKEREYSDPQELLGQDDEGEEDEAEDGGEDQDAAESPSRRGRAARSGARGKGRQSTGRARASSGGGQSSRSGGRQRSGSGSRGSRSNGGEAARSSRGRSASSGSRQSQSRSGGSSSSGGGGRSQSRSAAGRSSSRSGGQSRSSSGSRSSQSSRSSGRSSSGGSRSSGSSSRAQAGGRRRSQSRNDKR